MKNLNLHRTWEILSRVSKAQDVLAERSIYVHLLGARSNYHEMSFENFLDYYYSFKIQENELCIFNDDKISWEDYTVGDFNYLPLELLTYSDTQIDSWVESEVALQLKVQEEEKLREKENIRQEIQRLQNLLKIL